MSDTVNEVLEVSKEIAPNTPIVEAVSDVVETIANPTPDTLVEDLELAMSLIKKFKTDLAGVTPSALNIVKVLFHVMV